LLSEDDGRFGVRRVGRGVHLLGGLACLEVALVRVAGPVAAQVRALGGLGDRVVEPVAGLLVVLALAAELLAGYLLLVVAVRLAAWLPGVPGALAARGARLVAPPLLRRALDGLLGGVLLAQAVLAPAAAGAALAPAPPDRPPAAAAAALAGGAAAAVSAQDLPGFERGRHEPPGAGARQPGLPGVPSTGSTTPSPPRVPLPTWLGGSQPSGATAATATTAAAPGRASPPATGGQGPGASRVGSAGAAAAGAGRPYVIRPGDTLWDVAAAHLPRDRRSRGRIDRYWRRIYAANRGVLGDDPHLIHPGTRLVLPPADASERGQRRP
jgi:resuscitation-promoting factor RpfA